MEHWRDIAGSPGYQVSDLGRVRSLDRVLHQQQPYGVQDRRFKGKLLTPQAFSNGYLAVYLGRRNGNLVHRLVAIAFIPGDTALQVNHKNGKRDDNRAVNLEWLTCSDNHRHSYRELPRKPHGKTIVVIVGGNRYDSMLDAANALGVVAGSVASALSRGHRCKGLEVTRA